MRSASRSSESMNRMSQPSKPTRLGRSAMGAAFAFNAGVVRIRRISSRW